MKEKILEKLLITFGTIIVTYLADSVVNYLKGEYDKSEESDTDGKPS